MFLDTIRRRAVGYASRDDEVRRALQALAGKATVGDLVLATGYPLATVDAALHSLMAEGLVEVTVSESGIVVFRRVDGARPSGRTRRDEGVPPIVPGDRRTLRLIRAREGVVSIAELVEHTGLTVADARREAERLSRTYGGEAHTSWDGHVVYAFPELLASAHGELRVREPRPAWIRRRRSRVHQGGLEVGTVALSGAVLTLSWFATFPPGPLGRVLLLATVAGASAGAAFVAVASVRRSLLRHSRFRLRSRDEIRRLLLGHVIETALRGKGVVSVERAARYLEKRAGSGRVSRRRVEQALEGLAAEFGATRLAIEGDHFFGFRNVKRQFLASHVQRVRLRLARTADGRDVFDSGDTQEVATQREFELFDRDLGFASSFEPGGGPAPMGPPR